MNPPVRDYDESRDRRGSYGNVSNANGTKVIWWIMSIVGALIASAVLFMGNALYSLQGRVESIGAKVDILLEERLTNGRTAR